MEPDPADFDPFALCRCRPEKAREPSQRYAQRAAVSQIDPHDMFVKANRGRRNSHATLSIDDKANHMAVYVDDAIWAWRGLKWCHLLADDMDELHRFAARLGVFRSSYQGPPKTGTPHYDLTAFERRRAIVLGANPCDRVEIVAVLRTVRTGQGTASGARRVSSASPGAADAPASTRHHPLFGVRKRPVQVMSGTDLTKPADPSWG